MDPVDRWFLAFFIALAVYLLWFIVTVSNGVWREVTGRGHRPDKLHSILWRLHTGLHGNPFRSYGDEKRLKRTAGGTSRATPEGAMIYWTPWSRPMRAARNNGIVFLILFWLAGMVADTPDAVAFLTGFCFFSLAIWAVSSYIKARKKRESLDPLGSQKQNAKVLRTEIAEALADATPADLDSLPPGMGALATPASPQLTSEVPIPVLATLLAQETGASPAELTTLLRLKPDRGQLILPDRFAALQKQREPIEEIIRAHTEGKVGFVWKTTTNPRTLTWTPQVEHLPRQVRFRDYLVQIGRLAPGDFGLGVDINGQVYVESHNGDTPWNLRSIGSGGGKSHGFLVKAAQILHDDPDAELYCFDVKQISFEDLEGIPGIHLFNNPQSHMREFYEAWYTLAGIMADRYTAVREKRARPGDFHNIWVLVDEGNEMAIHLKKYYEKIKERGDPAQPKVWAEAISSLVLQGRQVNIRGEMMFQNMTDRVMGGISLRDAFGYYIMGMYTPNQFSRIVGNPVPELQTGVGRMIACKGKDRTWVQGFYDDPDWLRDYAMAGRNK